MILNNRNTTCNTTFLEGYLASSQHTQEHMVPLVIAKKPPLQLHAQAGDVIPPPPRSVELANVDDRVWPDPVAHGGFCQFVPNCVHHVIDVLDLLLVTNSP